MSAIALEHGGTIDKFIGDAMLVFFGDPETKGVAEDAQACLRMAVEMQQRLAQLNAKWRERGIEQPFRARMGINTGYCNVGNFGSDDRMDYTIIGAEANLAARLQSIAEPGGIVLSYETYALVRDIVRARPLAADHHEGHQPRGRALRRGRPAGRAGAARAGHQRARPGLDLFIDLDVIDENTAERAGVGYASCWKHWSSATSPPRVPARPRLVARGDGVRRNSWSRRGLICREGAEILRLSRRRLRL